MAPSILLGQTMKPEASTSRLFTVRARHSRLCTVAVPPSPRCGLAHLCRTVQHRGGLWFQPGAMLGLVIISRWHQHEQQMPSWPRGLNMCEGLCTCMCVCLSVCLHAVWLMPLGRVRLFITSPVISFRLHALSVCFVPKMTICPDDDNVIVHPHLIIMIVISLLWQQL